MRMGDAIETAPDLLRLLPGGLRAWVTGAVLAGFAVLGLIGRADDVFLWVTRELAATYMERFQPMVDGLLSPTPTP